MYACIISVSSQVVTETMEPWIERGLFAYQVVVDETLSARTGPHENAPGILQQLPPYSVAAAVSQKARDRTYFIIGDVRQTSLHLPYNAPLVVVYLASSCCCCYSGPVGVAVLVG